jgi:uncharacterized protein (DUF1810 family)
VRFALSGLDEARAYLAHPLLGGRLRDCTALVNAVEGHGVDEIFGYPDDLKFHSSVTLFAQAGDEEVFVTALRKYFAGASDQATINLLQRKTAAVTRGRCSKSQKLRRPRSPRRSVPDTIGPFPSRA